VSATFAGVPKRSSRPPKATAQIPNHDQPIASPGARVGEPMHAEEHPGSSNGDADRDGTAGDRGAFGELPTPSTYATARYVAAAAVV